MLTTHKLPAVPISSASSLRGIARVLGQISGQKRKPAELVAAKAKDGSVWVGNSYVAVRLTPDAPGFAAAVAVAETAMVEGETRWATVPLTGPFRISFDEFGRRGVTAEDFEQVAHRYDTTPARMGTPEYILEVGSVVPITDGTDTAWMNSTVADLLRSTDGTLHISSALRPVSVLAEDGSPVAVAMPVRVHDAA